MEKVENHSSSRKPLFWVANKQKT